jgi:hypothetical protein
MGTRAANFTLVLPGAVGVRAVFRPPVRGRSRGIAVAPAKVRTLAQEAMSMTTPAALLVFSQVQDEAYRYAYALGDAAVAAVAVAALGAAGWLGLRAFYFLRDMQLAGLLTLRRRPA